MIRRDTPGLRWISIVLAFLFMLVPLPGQWSGLKPFLLALVIVFWVLEVPEKMGLGRIFLIGLALDLAGFNLLGEHALRLLLIAGIVLQMRSQFRFYPVWQQSLVLLAVLYLDLLLYWILHRLQGDTIAPGSWLAPLLAFLIWPWLYMWLDNLRLQNRSK
jgi:rod shape-determining protein MreD